MEKLQKLLDKVETMRADFEKSDKDNVSAKRRLRGALQELKVLAQDLRLELLAEMKAE